MKQILIDTIGQYTPDLTAEGIAQIDWAWIGATVLLIVFIYSLIKLLGGLLRAK